MEVRNRRDNLLIYLKGIRYRELEAIIKFIYLGQISIREEDLENFMIAAKELQIEELLCNSLSNEEVQSNFIGASDDFLTNDSITFNKSDTIESEINVIMVEGQFNELVEQFYQYRKEESDKIPCDQCKYRASKPYTLKKHKETVHSTQEYKCDNCEKVFKTPAMCKEHNKIVHTVSQYPCNLCDYRASSIRIMKLHKETIHFL